MAKKTSKLREKLTNKYRLVVLNEETYEERISFKLSRLNVYVYGGTFAVLLIVLTTILIAYTPLREYVPGYSSSSLKKKATNLTNELDSLQIISHDNETKLHAMMQLMRGEESTNTYFTKVDSILKSEKDATKIGTINASKEDSIFRNKVINRDMYNVNTNHSNDISIVLFSPTSGTITNKFNSEEQHFAVDIAVKKDSPIKAIADGTVIFAEWSVDTGYVVIIDHGTNLLSVYKHNSQLFKRQGEIVKSGEVVALAGSAGELSTATHLHFELWYNGYPMDPTNFMDFE